MGKSPGKWIKSVLFGKKTSKSNLLKKTEISKSSYEKASPAPSKEPVRSLAVEPSLISELAPVTVSGEDGKDKSEFGNGVVAALSNDELTLSSAKQDGDPETDANHVSPHDMEGIRLEQAAIKAQAIFRGYLARREFQTLKGIIRLQAHIRGHLVRRQAVATLNCVLSIVRFQALVRGRRIRLSDIGSQVREKLSLPKTDAKVLNSSKVNTYTQGEKLVKNAFLRQLLFSSPTALPILLQQAEPNSAWNWLFRWTISNVWSSHIEQKKTADLEQIVETEKSLVKRNGQKKQSANFENGHAHSASESEKPKRNPKKVLKLGKAVQEQARNDIEKLKLNAKKISNSASEVSVHTEVDTNKSKRNRRNSSNSSVPEFTGKIMKTLPDKSMEDLEGSVSNLADEVRSTLQPADDDPINDLEGHLMSNGQAKQFSIINETISKEDQISIENHNMSKRRVSLPAKHDDQETLQRGIKVPSYMAATKSAKAKVRGQISPRFGQDMAENNGITRRHSLPSFINAKLSSSPRVQKLVQTSGKGGIKIDRSLSSSRDSNDKVIQAEWRR